MSAEQFIFWLRGYLSAYGENVLPKDGVQRILAELGRIGAPAPALPNDALRRALDEWKKRRSTPATLWPPVPRETWTGTEPAAPPYEITCADTASPVFRPVDLSQPKRAP